MTVSSEVPRERSVLRVKTISSRRYARSSTLREQQRGHSWISPANWPSFTSSLLNSGPLREGEFNESWRYCLHPRLRCLIPSRFLPLVAHKSVRRCFRHGIMNSRLVKGARKVKRNAPWIIGTKSSFGLIACNAAKHVERFSRALLSRAGVRR